MPFSAAQAPSHFLRSYLIPSLQPAAEEPDASPAMHLLCITVPTLVRHLQLSITRLLLAHTARPGAPHPHHPTFSLSCSSPMSFSKSFVHFPNSCSSLVSTDPFVAIIALISCASFPARFFWLSNQQVFISSLRA